MTSFSFLPFFRFYFFQVNVDLFDKQMLKIRSVSNFPFVTGDSDNVISLCLETILTRKGVLIFCSSKNGCEKLAENIAKQLHTIITGKETSGDCRADLTRITSNLIFFFSQLPRN